MKLETVIKDIESKRKCAGCELEKEDLKPLILKPDRMVKTIVITESPWTVGSLADLTSIVNIPTFNYLYTLFSGNFSPISEANVYWTHVCKCPLKGVKKAKIIRGCGKRHLRNEIRAVNPKLIVAVGSWALSFLAEYDERLQAGLTQVFSRQIDGIFKNVCVGDTALSLAVVPHPSGRNRFWNELSPDTVHIFDIIRREILESG